MTFRDQISPWNLSLGNDPLTLQNYILPTPYPSPPSLEGRVAQPCLSVGPVAALDHQPRNRQLLTVPGTTSMETICVSCEAATRCLGNAHLGSSQGVVHFQNSENKSEVICI